MRRGRRPAEWRGAFPVILHDDVFEQEIVEVYAFHEVARQKAHVVEFREVEDVRFQKDGRGDVQFVADVEKVVHKMRIGQLFGVFVYELPLYFSVFHDFCPDLRHVASVPRESRDFL